MEYEKDDELLDWDMNIDENYEEALNDDQQNLNQPPKRKHKEDSLQNRSPRNWVKFSNNDLSNINSAEQRKCGDGDSITSTDSNIHVEEGGGNLSAAVVTTNSAEGRLRESEKPHRENSFTSYLPSFDENGGSRFTILDEDDADITSYDVTPMEFRGSLKTGNPPYRPETSCCSSFIRYFLVALFSLALGVIIGYYMVHPQINNSYVTNHMTSTNQMTTRSIVETTQFTTEATISTSDSTQDGAMLQNESLL